MRREIAAIDPALTVFEVKRMADEVAAMLHLVRFAVIVCGGMGLFGLILAAVGLADVTAYAVAPVSSWPARWWGWRSPWPRATCRRGAPPASTR